MSSSPRSQAEPPRSAWPRRVTWLLLLGCILATGFLGIRHFDTIQDDAFISFQYAKQLARGNGLVFNLGERVEGYTNFLWVLLSTPLVASGWDPWEWAFFLTCPFALLTLLVLPFLSGQHAGLSFLGLVAPVFLIVNRAFLTSSSGGLETSLFTLLVTVSMLLATRSFEQRGLVTPACGPLLALACLTRPEGVLFTGFVGLLSLRGCMDRKHGMSRQFLWLVLFSILFVPYLVWKTLYFGKLLPNTFYAKTGGGSHVVQGWAFFVWFVRSHGVYAPALLVPLALVWTRGRRLFGRAVLLASVLSYTAYVIWVGGDFFEFRFFAPILPLFYYLVQEGLREFWNRLGSTRPVLAGGTMAVALGVSLALATPPLLRYEHPSRFGWTYQALYGDAWIKRFVEVPLLSTFVRPRESISLTGIGILPFYTDLDCLDMLGLIAPDVGTWKPGSPFGDLPGHGRYAYDAYAGRHIDYHVFNDVVPFDKIWGSEPVLDPRVISIRDPRTNRYFNFATSNEIRSFREELRRRGALVFHPWREPRILFDLESGSYDGWAFTGTAFGSAPVRGAFAGQTPVSSYQGAFLMNTYRGSDEPTGTATSPPFEIDRDLFFFRIGGGRDDRALRLELWVGDELVAHATGHDAEELRLVQFDVSNFLGRMATVVLKDVSSRAWGHLLVDEIGLGRRAG